MELGLNIIKEDYLNCAYLWSKKDKVDVFLGVMKGDVAVSFQCFYCLIVA